MAIRVTNSPVDVQVNGGTVRNEGPATVYFRDEYPVGSSLNDGSVTAGAAVVLPGTQWFATAPGATSYVNVYDIPAPIATPSIFTCPAPTGGDDLTSLQATVDSAESWVNNTPGRGAEVVLRGETYRTSGPLTIKSDNITLRGAGAGNPTGALAPSSSPLFGGSVIRPLSTFTGANVLTIAQAAVTRALTGVYLRDFAVDGNFLPGSTSGIYWQVFNGGMERLHVARVTNHGVSIRGNGATAYPNGAWDNQINRVKVNTTGGNGFDFGSYSSDHVMMGCIVEYTTGHGVYFDANSSANMLTACYIYNTTGKGVMSDTMHQQKFVGCRVQDTNGGIYLANTGGTGGFLISGCTLRNNSFATDNTTDAINVAPGISTRGGNITGNDFHTDVGNGNGGGAGTYNRARYGVNIANGNMIGAIIGPNSSGFLSAVSTFGTGPVNDSGSNTIVMGLGQSSVSTMELKLGNGVRVLSGTGTPEASKTAPVGSVYFRSDGGAATSFYVKETGAGNTGWVAK